MALLALNTDPAHLEGSFLLWQAAVLFHFLWPHDPPSAKPSWFPSSYLQTVTSGCRRQPLDRRRWPESLHPPSVGGPGAPTVWLRAAGSVSVGGEGPWCCHHGRGLGVSGIRAALPTPPDCCWSHRTPVFSLQKSLGSGTWLPDGIPGSSPGPASSPCPASP